MNFLIYHSGFVPGKPEGPYDPKRTDGIDALVTSLAGERRQAEHQRLCGARLDLALPLDARSGLRGACDGQAVQVRAARTMCSGARIRSGTARRRTRSRRFARSRSRDELRDKYGYPKITPQLRAKVFGLNATKPYRLAADELRKFTRRTRSRNRAPSIPSDRIQLSLTYGPRTRREFLNLAPGTRENHENSDLHFRRLPDSVLTHWRKLLRRSRLQPTRGDRAPR